MPEHTTVETAEALAEEHKQNYLNACKTIADMHAAAVGEIAGPIRGVVEDVADVREAMLRAEQERDGAYRERAHLVAWLAAMHESVIAPAPDVDEPGWQIVYVYAGGGQMSWHISPRDAELFKDVEHVTADHPRALWDGHSTEAKYTRIRNHTRVLYTRCGPECSEMHRGGHRCRASAPPPCDDPMHVGYGTAGEHIHGPAAG